MDNSQFRKYHLDTMSRIAAALNETMDADADAVQNAASNIKSFIQRKFGNEKWEIKRISHLRSLAKINSELKWREIDYEKLLTSRVDKKYLHPVHKWNVNEHKLSGVVELDTDIDQSFCEILNREFGQVYIISPLAWAANVQNAGLNFEFRHCIHSEGNEKTHIGVVQGNHFFSIHVIFQEHIIYIMDSLYALNEDHRLHVYVLVQHLQFCHKINKSIWEIFFVINNLKQDNGFDCGVFMLKGIESWVKGIRLPFSKEHVKNARHILIRETLDKKLLAEEN